MPNFNSEIILNLKIAECATLAAIASWLSVRFTKPARGRRRVSQSESTEPS